jgi:CAAX prenyl protease-like protein
MIIQPDSAVEAKIKSIRQNPWLVFLLPFIVYMAIGSFEPTPVNPLDADREKPNFVGLTSNSYPYVYSLKLAATLLVVAWLSPGYPKFTRFSFLSFVCGVVGVVLWVALAEFQKSSGFNKLLSSFISTDRPSFDPWNSDLHDNYPQIVWLFVVIRFVGLAIVVPLIEEMFLRGFVMRFTEQEKWWEVPWGTMTRNALIAGTVMPVLLHPGEILATVVWFGLIHWLYARTKNIWDCVIAHGITNLLLGIYVVKWQQWWLW